MSDKERKLIKAKGQSKVKDVELEWTSNHKNQSGVQIASHINTAALGPGVHDLGEHKVWVSPSLQTYTLAEVATILKDNIDTRDLQIDSNKYNNVLSGKDGVQCIVDFSLAENEDDAVEYLNELYLSEGASVSVNKISSSHQFKNSDNIKYPWIVAYFAIDSYASSQQNHHKDNYAQNILIGVKHDYAGYQHAMKAFRKHNV